MSFRLGTKNTTNCKHFHSENNPGSTQEHPKALSSLVTLPNVWRRIIALMALIWLPLLVLSFSEGLAFGHEVRIPFLYDLAMYGRFLLGLPLLLFAELEIDPAIRQAEGPTAVQSWASLVQAASWRSCPQALFPSGCTASASRLCSS